MKISLPRAAAAVAAMMLGGSSSAWATNPTLLYSFETLDSAGRPDGFGANGGGTTVSQDTIGATDGTESLKVSIVSGATFVGAQTLPTTTGGTVTLPEALNDPATTALSVDVTVAAGQEFTGVFADMGITEFGTLNDGSNSAVSAQTPGYFQHTVALPDGTYRIVIPLVTPNDAGYTTTGPNGTGIPMSQFFGPDSDQATPTSFEFYFNKGTTADNGPLTVYLDNVQAVSDSIWGLTGGGSIATASNFFGTAPNGVDAAVDFDNILGSASTITVGSATTLGTVRFNSSSTYTLSGVGPITLQTSTGSALIEADLATTQIINVPMTVASNATFTTQNGGAELTIASPLTVASGKSVTQSGPGMINYTSTISLQTGASLTFGNNTSPTALTLTTGSVATIAPHGSGEKILLQLGALNFGGTANSWQGQLDVADNDLIVHNANLSAIANQIRTGFNAGSGYWNGSGITSSVAHSNPSHLTTLGYGVGGSPFDGVNTTATDVLVKYTYYGDANLDGTVTGADYQQIDTGFGLHLTGWQNGDFNYDGVVDGSDYSLIDNTFNQITATGASALAIVAAPADLSSVPEPTTLALLAMGTIGVLGSRRRRDA